MEHKFAALFDSEPRYTPEQLAKLKELGEKHVKPVPKGQEVRKPIQENITCGRITSIANGYGYRTGDFVKMVLANPQPWTTEVIELAKQVRGLFIRE